MASLDTFMRNVVTQDTRSRTQVHSELVSYLSDPGASLDCEDIDQFINGLVAWVNSSNFKISLNGLEVLCLMVDRMGEEFKPYVNTVLPAVVDRLGDAKDQVRDQAQKLLLKLMMPASSPQYVFERITSCFTHKLWHVREGILVCLQNTINTYGARSLQLNKAVPSIIKLLEDQNAQVREAAISTLVEIYRHVGERVRFDLAKKELPPGKLNHLNQKFDEIKKSGNMLPTADVAPIRKDYHSEDETDFIKPMSRLHPIRRSSSATARKSSGLARAVTTARQESSAGAVDEDLFIKSFEDVTKVQIYSCKDIQTHFTKVKDTLGDSNNDWEKRVESLRLVRALLICGAADYEDFYSMLRTLEPAFCLAIKDLRSQVVREACITTAFISQQLGNKCDHFAEAMLQNLIALVSNTAKVMATSGAVCIRFLIQFTHSSKFIPIITGNFSSKNSIIRRLVCECLKQILLSWPTHILEKHIAILQDAIKRGISDPDSETRAHSRKAYWHFATHFRDQADALLNSLDVSKQKVLQGELSNSSSNNSLNSADSLKLPASRSRSASQDRIGFDSLTRGGTRRSVTSKVAPSPRQATHHRNIGSSGVYGTRANSTGGIVRSSSDVDLTGSARIYPSFSRATALRLTPDNTRSLPRHKTSSNASSSISGLVSPERGRTRSRIGVSQSQPSSRSGSPSSRVGYSHHGTSHHSTHHSISTPKARRSAIPRSQGTSRETSPNRSTYGRERRLSGSRLSTLQKPNVITQRVLRPGSDSEAAIADALGDITQRGLGQSFISQQQSSLRKRYESYDSDDAGSETSSLCSERSFSSYGRTSERGDSQSKDSSANEQDIYEIIRSLSSSSHTERKEGLYGLKNVLLGARVLNRVELRKVTEIFTRMFHDPSNKVLSIFLDILVLLITVHTTELNDWLNILLTKLLNKTGTDVLGSIQTKIQKALETVRECFPCSLQFSIATRFCIDQTQSPNLKPKVKAAVLQYMHALILLMDPSDFNNSSDSRLAVSRIITWTTEPKSADVRKAAQAVLIALFNLNTAEFSMMLSILPKAFQDGATKILHNHVKYASSHSDSDVLSPRNATSPVARLRPPSRSGEPDEYETENMNPQDIYNSIKKTSADIQNLSYNSKLDHFDDVKKKKEFTSQDSGIQDLRNDSPDVSDPRKTFYNPSHYQDEHTLNGYNRTTLSGAMLDVDNELFNEGNNQDQDEQIQEILTELSNHNSRNDERKNAMHLLMKLAIDGKTELWDKHFKPVLLILLETLADDDYKIRGLTLCVLRDILHNQPTRFKDYAELTILKVLESHKDLIREVVKAAEECAGTLANVIPPEQSIRILNPLIQSSQYPVILAAIKMQNKVIELLPKEELETSLTEIVPGLLKSYDDSESTVRKASVFCLVSIYMAVGDNLRPYLSQLNYSKMKLLKLYIKRAQSQKDGSKGSKSPLASADT
ncbi:CLIP-associating protein 1-B isoform X5 [Octopus sinensis]|uniref:CLIP-associating protein 1-B isoform X5 n=1 Tax=Octopus sinensis TaxID=2607531 RepID=A0A7E6FEF5_9MOLL|nr:CLIP-associating protein 1-B isoform X5 [Octopus sinensis]